jgi:hypothetical protein
MLIFKVFQRVAINRSMVSLVRNSGDVEIGGRGPLTVCAKRITPSHRNDRD